MQKRSFCSEGAGELLPITEKTMSAIELSDKFQELEREVGQIHGKLKELSSVQVKRVQILGFAMKHCRHGVRMRR